MVSAEVLHRATILCLVVGLAFSFYAMAESLTPSLQSTCNVNAWVQCGAVDQSAYSHVGPVPDYAIGIGGFVAMLVVEVLLLRTYDPRYLQALLGLSFLGVVASVGFGYTEMFLIDPHHFVFCPICLGAYFSNVGVLACALGLLRLRRRGLEEERQDEPAEQDRPSKGSKSASSAGRDATIPPAEGGAPEA